MVNNQKWLEEAFAVQIEILPNSEQLSIGNVRQKSPDSALLMAEYIYRHIMENSGNNVEFKNMLIELDIFSREDRIRAIGFFYENIDINGANGNGCSIGGLKQLAGAWKLVDKFDNLIKAFFTETPTEIEDVKIEDVVEEVEEVLTIPDFRRVERKER